ncbi:lipase family alpha/beta hydrolase [Streptomyces sp. NBC_01190]|uniref:lipase family alpha/beta hydrolase n=1 Tax=Streptomyces sp. NBC_01190 TaxID=2903767 RepID=UPI00386B6178|nr:alpha/beta fold hydrolase [Streptomyces sp. NBC_01190]
MTAKSSEAGPEAESGGSYWGYLSGHGRWGSHGVDLVRVTAIDLAVLAGHLLLYPTGILPERLPGPPHATADAEPVTDDPAAGQPPAADTPTPTVTPAHTATPEPRPTPAPTPAPAPAPTDEHPTAPPPTEAATHPPVLLLHGFVDNRSAFALLRRSLVRNGWPEVQALNYSPLTSDIRTAAEMLGPHIERVCEQSGHRRVDIVAHSLGGLVARYYVQRLGGDARVRTLVTLGTPHSGTRAVPALVPHPLARQMRPGSDVLTELAAPAEHCQTRFVAFWSDLDQVMIPAEAARLDHPDLRTRNIQVHGIGHLSLPVHASVAAEIRRVLSGEGPLPGVADAA